MSTDQEQTIAVRVLDTSQDPYTWYPPLTTEAFRLSVVGDSINSGQPTVAVDGSTFHVFWQDIVDGRRRLMHRFNSTPTDTTTWSPTMEVFPDVPGDAKRPTAVAASGTVHAVASGDTEGWYRTGSTFSGFSFSANTTTTASAGVYFLEGDLEVPSTSTLSLPEGTTLSFARAEDYVHASGVGSDDSRAELKVLGRFISDGDSSAPVLLSSPGHAAGTWGGAIFDLSGCEDTAYGYFGTFEPVSDIHDTHIEFGEKGISLENFGAPRLADVTFSEIANDREIYLDSTDVFLPAGHFGSGTCSGHVDTSFGGTWSLGPGTHVVAANASTNDATWIGTSGKSDLVADATFEALGAEGDSVFLRPDSGAAGGDNWGGLTARRCRGQQLDRVHVDRVRREPGIHVLPGLRADLEQPHP
ncbi:MAG: hypothetical protein R3B81_12005 [bacterium]